MIDLGLLKYIDPNNYDTWLKTGMALKAEGEPFEVWDEWSRGSPKYKASEMRRKWDGFQREDGVAGGTLVYLAQQNGYRSEDDRTDYDLHNLLLDATIVDPTFVREERVPEPADKYSPTGDLLEYLTTLFEPGDFVGYCVKFWQPKPGEWKPLETGYRVQAGFLIDNLRAGKRIEDILGKPSPEAGAYIRFNPLDGHGENDANVMRYKYCLIESDTDSIEKQYSLLKAMNLPIEFLIHSGGKSLHAIVRVDAENAQQYRRRVQDLYEFCKKSGLSVDENDKNESRFSRMPGIKRGDKWQYIVARQIGARSYKEWMDWRQDQADDLPPNKNLGAVWDNSPPVKDELIGGVLRVGHKMLLAGPSKAGKSFALMNLCVSIAEGLPWLGLPCKQGRVCYVNLELDEASCFKRFHDIYTRLGIDPANVENIDVWNLRGHAVPMDKLAPILIHRYMEQKYTAVIIDPIYKVITGDENNATEMGRFCNNFDRVATALGVSVIYCHHHSKGASGKYANAADRASGSGVFARDPDAIIDLSELKVEGHEESYRTQYPDASTGLTGWEVAVTVREFPPHESFRVWFDWPIHRVDEFDLLTAAPHADGGVGGVAKDQKSQSDWFDRVGGMLDITTDTAVTLEQVDISESNAKKIFTTGSDFELATIGGEKVVHRRSENKIVYKDVEYAKTKQGVSVRWVKIAP